MPFELVTKAAGGSSQVQNDLYIGSRWTRIPAHARKSLGGLVTILVDRENGLVALRNAGDDDTNAYILTTNNVVGCRAISRFAEEMGKRTPISVPITYDAEMNAWVADLNAAE